MSFLVSTRRLVMPPQNRLIQQGSREDLRDAVRDMWDVVPVYSPTNSGDFEFRFWFTPTCFFVLTENGPQTVDRSKGQIEEQADTVMIARFLRGGIRASFEDVPLDRFPGEVYLNDQGFGTKGMQFAAVSQNIVFEKSYLGYDSEIHGPLVHLSETITTRKLLNSLMSELFRDLATSDSLNAETLEQFTACIKVLLRSENQDGDVRRHARNALGRLIAKFIQQNLTDPDLSANSILLEFGLSRATLYRIFEPMGGVRNYIREKRLVAAVAELGQAPYRRGQIQAVSDHWGYSSGANFNRAVRDMFGVSPGSLFGWRASEQTV